MEIEMAASLEKRVAAVERELAQLREKLAGPRKPWWEKVWGTFANDPSFEEASRLGREYRASLDPRKIVRKKRKPGHAHS